MKLFDPSLMSCTMPDTHSYKLIVIQANISYTYTDTLIYRLNAYYKIVITYLQ